MKNLDSFKKFVNEQLNEIEEGVKCARKDALKEDYRGTMEWVREIQRRATFIVNDCIDFMIINGPRKNKNEKVSKDNMKMSKEDFKKKYMKD